MVTPVPIEFSAVPRYRQLANILIEQIKAGELPPGTPIPSKRVIRETYGVAGSTCDRAIDVLKEAGMVITVPGLGLFVTDRNHWR